MQNIFKEGRIEFSFPDNWLVLRPEDSSYYSRHFNQFALGNKEMDFLAWNSDLSELWLIEVKDYTTSPRTKQIDLFDEVAIKVRDSLALILSGAVNAQDDKVDSISFFSGCLPPKGLRIALHLELPQKPSKLFPGTKITTDALQSLRGKMRCVDRRAILVSTHTCIDTPWTATWKN